MKNAIEASYMNDLAFPLRAAAHDIYVFENIDELVKMRLCGVTDSYKQLFSLTEAQWIEVLDTAILTRLSQIELGKHLGAEEFLQMDYLIKLVLQMEGASIDEMEEILESAPNLKNWYLNLRKCLKQS